VRVLSVNLARLFSNISRETSEADFAEANCPACLFSYSSLLGLKANLPASPSPCSIILHLRFPLSFRKKAEPSISEQPRLAKDGCREAGSGN
jgi:hypothetical protein